ncbi:MAG TPA: glutamate--tRNA ligase, partial [Nitrososphaerales archaeon]|nr:glutamate--tRNA ligase [Nitrososphaerales archaeon]
MKTDQEMFSDDELSQAARKFAFLNALEHSGKANPNAVIGRILSEHTELRKESSRLKSIVQSVTTSVNQLSPSEQKSRLQKEFPGELETSVSRKKEISNADATKKPELPDLPDVLPGGVVTRFPPEPNGYMHIGHAKAALLGFEYARKYRGRFMVRFDDTNPAAEKKEFYGAFIESLDWLGIKPDQVKNASDDMEKFYHVARQLIEKFSAYVCSCTQEKMRELRGTGLPCEHRSQSAQENFDLWDSMLSGSTAAKQSVLRFVGNMESLNTAMRDPVLFRVVEQPHPLRGMTFRVWPTYDFDGPIEDSLDGITHAMRSKEYELRDELYYAILDSAGLRKPRIIEFSRLALKNTTVSKRNLRKLIEEGHVQGWDDPRLPTIAGLKRRGILPEAIREFILSMGISKVESLPTWDLLESINRKLLDPVAKRFFFAGDPVSVEVDEHPRMEVNLRFHPEADFGSRQIETEGSFLISGSDASQLKIGSRFRLIETYNCEVHSRERELIRVRQVPEEPGEKISKVQWVTPKDSVPFTVMMTGPLLLDESYNPESLKLLKGRIEISAERMKIGEIFQLVRIGFCRLDSPVTA